MKLQKEGEKVNTIDTNNSTSEWKEAKPAIDPLYWEAILQIELGPFRELVNSKCQYLVTLDKKLQALMKDPEGNEALIKKNLLLQERLSCQITVCTNLLNAIEPLQQSYMETTVKMYEVWKMKEAIYQREIKGLKSHIGLLNDSILL